MKFDVIWGDGCDTWKDLQIYIDSFDKNIMYLLLNMTYSETCLKQFTRNWDLLIMWLCCMQHTAWRLDVLGDIVALRYVACNFVVWTKVFDQYHP